MVLCCSLTMHALSLFQIEQRGVQMVGSELSRTREEAERGERTREDRLPFSPSSFYFFVHFSAALFNLNVWNRLARPKQVFV